MKLLAISDTHIAAKIGRRKDDVVDTVVGKLAVAQGIAHRNDCKHIVHCGDVFDRPLVPRSIEQALRGQIACSGLKHWVCYGTHDIGRGNYKSLMGKSVSCLPYSGGIELISSFDSNLWVASDESQTTAITLVGAACRDDTTWKTMSGEVNLIAAHKMIVPDPVPWDHLLVTDIETDADIVISGDYHPGFDPVLHDGTWFCGVGALTRTFREKHDLTRRPRCVIIDTDLLPDNPFELVPLPDHAVKPVEEVYDAESLSVEEHREELRTTVSDALKRAKTRETATWDEAIRLLLEDPAAFEEATGVSAADGAERLRELCTKIEGDDAD